MTGATLLLENTLSHLLAYFPSATGSLFASASPLSLGPSPVLTVIMLVGLGLLAFAFLMVSSFVKIAVVLSILRTALGLNNIPPASVITGLAVILSLYVMAPTGMAVAKELQPALASMGVADLPLDLETRSENHQARKDDSRNRRTSKKSNVNKEGTDAKAQVATLFESLNRAKVPIKKFLKRHAHRNEVALFAKMSRKSYAKAGLGTLGKDSLVVLVPAFVISELKEAFQIGFLLFIPFLVIDILVSNILMALGMHMLSPTTISLPFKLLLFVMANGWYLLTRGLITGYF